MTVGPADDVRAARTQARKQSLATIALLLVAGLGVAALTISRVIDNQIPEQPAVVDGALTGVLDAWSARFPERDSEGYAAPAPADIHALRTAMEWITQGMIQEASASAASAGYEVRTVSSSGGKIFVVTEGSDAEPRGWGTFFYRPSATSEVIVEVTHPAADTDTETFGLALFQRVGARALLLAGAHRYANDDGTADVAHTSLSIFQALHSILATPSSIVIQPHGFEDGGRSDYFGDAVVSSGTAEPDQVTVSIAQSLERAGFDVCLYRGSRCSALAGTTNVQRRTLPGGAEFTHIELALPLRQNGKLRAKALTAIATSLLH